LLKGKIASKKIYSQSSKGFRNFRDDIMYFPDHRIATGRTVNPYKPQFTLTEEERRGNP